MIHHPKKPALSLVEPCNRLVSDGHTITDVKAYHGRAFGAPARRKVFEGDAEPLEAWRNLP